MALGTLKKESYKQHIYIAFGLSIIIFFTILIYKFYHSFQECLLSEQRTYQKEKEEQSGTAFDAMIRDGWSLADFFAEELEQAETSERKISSMLKAGNDKLYQEGAEFLAAASDGAYYSADGWEGIWETVPLPDIKEETLIICPLGRNGGTEEDALIFLKPLSAPVMIEGITVTHILFSKEISSLWEDIFCIDDEECRFCIVDEDGKIIYQDSGQAGFQQSIYDADCVKLKEASWTMLFLEEESVPEQMADVYRKLLFRYCFLVFVMLVLVISGSMVFFFQAQNSRRLMRQKEGANRLLSRAVLEADAANEAKRSFLSHVSHDIRTPINGIMGMTEIAMKNLCNTEKMKDCLKKISGSSRHLLSLVNDVLDMSRIESGKTVLSYERLNVTELLEHCCSILGGQLLKKHIVLEKDIETLPHPYAIGDELHLRQIFINILGNAVKFTPEGGSIRLRAYEVKSNETKMMICFEIEDNGPGMSRDFLETIFEPYSQEKSAMKEEGTGLGMTITKHFVDLMGGTIEVKSELTKGSSFFVTIPFDIAAAPKQTAEQEKEMDLSNRNLLLVEDNELNLEIARDMLMEEGIHVTVAKNGKEAVEIFMQSEPGEYDLILMDIIMPVMDGLEATRRIRRSNHPSAESIPILAMTANAYAEDVEKSKAAGMNAHLSKPVEMEELRQRLYSFWKK